VSALTTRDYAWYVTVVALAMVFMGRILAINAAEAAANTDANPDILSGGARTVCE
jgi:hypothetical protein